MHEAEQYLRNPETPNSLYIQYQGRRRRLFYNRDQNICGIIGIGRRRYGFEFGDWDGIEKIFKPAPDKDPEEINRRLIRKFQREAAKADSQAHSSAISRMPITEKVSIKTGSRPAPASTGRSLRSMPCGDTAAKRPTGVSARQSIAARRSTRAGLTFGATTVRYGWSPAIRMMATTGLETWPQDSPKSTADAVTVITTCLSTNRPSLAAI